MPSKVDPPTQPGPQRASVPPVRGWFAAAALLLALRALALVAPGMWDWGWNYPRFLPGPLVAGAFRTPMLEGAWERAAGLFGADVAAMEERYRSRIPLGRIGRPEEAAEAATWLCSDAASYVTGHSMIVDGGWSASLR